MTMRTWRTTPREETVQDTKGDGTAEVCGREHEKDQPSGYNSTRNHYCAAVMSSRTPMRLENITYR